MGISVKEVIKNIIMMGKNAHNLFLLSQIKVVVLLAEIRSWISLTLRMVIRKTRWENDGLGPGFFHGHSENTSSGSLRSARNSEDSITMQNTRLMAPSWSIPGAPTKGDYVRKIINHVGDTFALRREEGGSNPLSGDQREGNRDPVTDYEEL